MLPSDAQINLLLGGGIDSSALIAFYLARGATVRGIHFNYGQPSLDGERRSILALSQHYAIPLTTVDLGLSIVSAQGEYHCRNATLLLAAASIFPAKQGRFSIGIHSGTSYYDCSKIFMADIQRIFDGYFGGCIQVEAPFLEFTKADIFNFCTLAQVPVELTFSCERRGDFPCGQCSSCLDRRILHESS
ncbi:7-cyano-7-deazaguanine synthase [Aerosakkonema funiforme]|uniref:7-cyano-7-deazaguanine synthase n=1 Tax=Aerosakkonema funiforme FACHB-1375 TaxID=2949571 RepID=A0A926VM28_9CYAN|nr:7-cyano-7-deazaguanine synthase [Aerosakkonema funiforme]MBD2186430.1 7-cyano-7-deazaguanine synthase [Aerosakkonema funiforme FACHB-1375]